MSLDPLLCNVKNAAVLLTLGGIARTLGDSMVNSAKTLNEYRALRKKIRLRICSSMLLVQPLYQIAYTPYKASYARIVQWAELDHGFYHKQGPCNPISIIPSMPKPQ
jgi:hypothetical protein